MNGKEAIIEKIISDAKSKSNEMLSLANAKAKDISNEAQSQSDQRFELTKKTLAEQNSENLRRRMLVAQLDGKKLSLKMRQELLSDAFFQAREQVKALPKEKYLALISRLIKQYAEQDENVVICKNDAEKIDQKFLDTFMLNLKLSEKFGDFDGGIVLCKRGYDKNLTLDVLMKELREQKEDEVANCLFEVK